MIIGYLTESIIGSKLGEGVFYIYNSALIFPASVCLFMTFKHVNIKNKFINRFGLSLGAVCFGVYLATDNNLIREQLWKTINLPGQYKYGIPIQLVFIVLVVIILFTVGCVLEKARVIILRMTQSERICKSIDSKFSKAMTEFKMVLEKRIYE